MGYTLMPNTEAIRDKAADAIADRLGVARDRVWVQVKRIDYENDFMLEPNMSVNAYMMNPDTLEIGYAISTSTLVQLPGCCGICVSTGAFVKEDLRGMGIGTIMATLRLEVAKAYGFTAMLCTDVAKNGPQQGVLNKHGYEKVFEFKNSRTDNDVLVHMRLI
jgi:ribosomal protein S18 acetylase RimI-like enzyme